MDQSKALKPIYKALDTNNYAKAYKLTLSQPQCNWAITRALKAHSLERQGRTYEACCALRVLLELLDSNNSDNSSSSSSSSSSWLLELDNLIWIWSQCRHQNVAGGSDSTTESTVEDSKMTVSKRKTANHNTVNKEQQQQKEKENHPLDLVHVLDLPIWKRHYELGRLNKYDISNLLNKERDIKITEGPDAVVDETTLATIAVTLRALRLYSTLAQMYTKSIDILTSNYNTIMKSNSVGPQKQQQFKEELCTVLIQAYLSHICVAATHASNSRNIVSNSTTTTTTTLMMKQLFHTKKVLEAYESSQLTAMQLVRHSGVKLHMTWCAHATWMHLQTCKEMTVLFQSACTTHINITTTTDNNNELEACMEKFLGITPEYKTKLQLKLGMLPRLAESIMSKVVTTDIKEGEREDMKHIISCSDWKLYIALLQERNMYEEALNVLEHQIQCVTNETTTTTTSPKIHDENDVRNHMGSLIQMSETERLELMAKLLHKMGNHDSATKIYANHLLKMMPDQWSYWMELLNSDNSNNDYDEQSENYKMILGESVQTTPMRGPHLFLVEAIAHKIRLIGKDKDDSSARLTTTLCEKMIDYASIFAPKVSCCFQDLRPYIGLLVKQTCDEGSISDEVMKLLTWSRKLCLENDLPSNESFKSTDLDTNKKTRRTKLRSFIFSIQLCFEIWYQLNSACKGNADYEASIDNSVENYIPSAMDMMNYYINTLDLGSNPSDGGQKESLPGDELILLSTQLLIHQSRYKNEQQRKATNILVAAVLDKSINLSPYNIYLKIAALRIHAMNGASLRAWDVYSSMEVKYIQLDSCSYLILPHLIEHGLYREAIKLAGNIINLHSTSAKDIIEYSGKAFENGKIDKGQEMIDWQRTKMLRSFQLVEAKGLIMDSAPLLSFGDSENGKPLGSHHGLYGGDTDFERSEKMIRDSDIFYSAPSLLGLSIEEIDDSTWSDNRDLTVNQFEVLVRTPMTQYCSKSVQRAHIHAVLNRVVLLLQVAKPPKKGKVVKCTIGESLDLRSNSLLTQLDLSQLYFNNHMERYPDNRYLLWTAMLSFANTIVILSCGKSGKASSEIPGDSLSARELKCVELLKEACDAIKKCREIFCMKNESQRKLVCELIPEFIIPVFAALESTGTLFSLFGLGKRKRKTKASAAALADASADLHGLISDMKDIIGLLPPISFEGSSLHQELANDIINQSKLNLSGQGLVIHETFFSSKEGQLVFNSAVEHIVSGQACTRERVEPFLNHMLEVLNDYITAE